MTSIIENTCVMIRSAELALTLPHIQGATRWPQSPAPV